jgi:hypothetical protein
MLAGVVLHLAESHGHEHGHDVTEHEHAHRHDDGHHDHAHVPMPTGAHSQRHRHETMWHAHSHVPDAHHAHRHRDRLLSPFRLPVDAVCIAGYPFVRIQQVQIHGTTINPSSAAVDASRSGMSDTKRTARRT